MNISEIDSSVTPEYLAWLGTPEVRIRNGIGGNEAWNAALAWKASQRAPQGVAETISMPMTEFLESVTGVLNIANKMCATLERERDALRAQVSTGTNQYTGLYDIAVIDALKARVAELERDAARYRWLTEDHADAKTREACRELLYRMPVMSYAAASHDIDAAIAASKEAP